MPDLVIGARDAPAAERYRADLVCDGRTDLAVLAKAVAVSDREVELTAGTFNANGGHAPDGSRCPRVAEGVTVRGRGPGLTRPIAGSEPCRIAIATDRPMETVEVRPPSVNSANMAGVTAGNYPPRPLPTA